jgi:hypothetical protein
MVKKFANGGSAQWWNTRLLILRSGVRISPLASGSNPAGDTRGE